MKYIPLTATPSQTLTVRLSDQAVQLRIYQRRSGLYMDVYVNNTLIIGGVLCHDRNFIVRNTYLGFTGDLMFIDQNSTNDPAYTGLGDRYLLAYLDEDDFA